MQSVFDTYIAIDTWCHSFSNFLTITRHFRQTQGSNFKNLSQGAYVLNAWSLIADLSFIISTFLIYTSNLINVSMFCEASTKNTKFWMEKYLHIYLVLALKKFFNKTTEKNHFWETAFGYHSWLVPDFTNTTINAKVW